VKFELDKEAAAAAKPERAFPERWLNLVSGQGSERLELALPVFWSSSLGWISAYTVSGGSRVSLLLYSPERPDK